MGPSSSISPDVIRRRLLLVALVLCGTLAAGFYAFSHVVVNGTPSIDARILLKTSERPRKGDYVLAPAAHPYMPPGYKHLAKKALCVAGEELSFSHGAFTCAGVVIATVKAETRTGAPLAAFEWTTGPIPDGYVFVGSAHPDGFDSRYLGLFAADELVRLERLL